MDFRDRLCYDLVWETTEKQFEPSTFSTAYFVDVESAQKLTWEDNVTSYENTFLPSQKYRTGS